VDLPLAGKRLLLVSEDAELSALVAQALARLGAEVQRARTGQAGLAAVSAGAPDAAVVDVPVSDGPGGALVEALARAKVPTVAVSGVYRGARAGDALRRLGAADFLEKPFPLEALGAAVARALGAPAPAAEEGEAPDEVTGARPLAASEVQGAIAADAPVPVLEEPPAPGASAGPTARVGFATRLPEPPPSPRSAAAVAPARSGELGDTTVPRLLVALHVGQATGALTLERGPVRKLLVVEKGVPVYAASNVGAERFASICVRRGVVTADALEAVRAASPERGTAEALLAAGRLTPEKRAELVVGQLRAIAWSTFEWREGRYAFQLGRPPARRVPLSVGMGELLLDGMRRASTLPRLRGELPAGTHLAPAPDPAFELYALRLRGEEARLLAVADGTKSVADLLRLTELPERDALAFLQACRVMRILDDVARVLASTRRIGFM
jgi:ActR/RegA family two-component response regulator